MKIEALSFLALAAALATTAGSQVNPTPRPAAPSKAALAKGTTPAGGTSPAAAAPASAATRSGGGSVNAAPPPANDDCNNPMVISGTGAFPFDTTTATTGTQGQGNCECDGYGTANVENDVWYRW